MASNQYPGNPSLPAETRQRVVSTFRQSVELFRNGNRDDAVAGCDFILKLDPLFDPAKRFMEHLEQPATTLDLDALLATVAGSDVLEEARAALDGRDFARALDLTSDILRSDFTNLEAQQIAEEAQSKLEAAPFIDQFVKSARAKVQSGNTAGATTDLEKARQLDAGHPLVRQLEQELGGGTASPGGADASFDVGGDFASPFSSGFSSPDPFASSAPVSGFGMPSFGSDSGPSAAPEASQEPQFGDPFAAPASSSFVVDAPNTSGSQASDFGFTFEEDQPGAPADPGFGNPFGGARVPGAGDTFDFTTASVETTPDDQENINRYLKEGDAAYDAGEYQRAIDTWSKIFLIDVTNDDASHRIEKARAKRQEIDRHIEELVVAGTLAFEKRDLATAKAKFQEVLGLDPSHFNARQYLDQIESGGAAAVPSSSSPSAPGSDFFDDDEAALGEAPLVPPDAATTAKKTKVTAAAPAKGGGKRLPLIPIVIGLVVLLGAGYFAWSKFGGGNATGNPAATQQIFSKADRLAQQGKFDGAIALLAGVANDDPEHDRALEMISDLRERKAQAAGTIGGRPAAQVFAEFLAKGKEAYAAGDYLAAKDMLDKARAIQALPVDVQPLYQTASQQVAKLENAIVLLREGKYADGIGNLESLLQQDPNNVSVRGLLSKAHFNYGVAYLQQDSTGPAMAEFDRALQLNPNDADAKRSRELASKYDGQQKDLLYRIYVKYLPGRPL